MTKIKEPHFRMRFLLAEKMGFCPLIRGRQTEFARGLPSAAEQSNPQSERLKQVIPLPFTARIKKRTVFDCSLFD